MNIYDERRRKINTIVSLYKDRSHIQQEIADKFQMPISEVREVLVPMNFEHTTKKTLENLKNGTINMCINLDDFGFLDKYNF